MRVKLIALYKLLPISLLPSFDSFHSQLKHEKKLGPLVLKAPMK